MNDTDLERRLTGIMSEATGRPIDTGRAWRDFEVLRSRSSRNRRRVLTAAVAAAAALAIAVPTLAGSWSAVPAPGSSVGPRVEAPLRSYPGAIVARIPVSGVGTVVQDGTRVWALRYLSITQSGRTTYQLIGIDLGTDRVVLRKDVGTSLTTVAAGGGTVWLTSTGDRAQGQLVRIDPGTGHVIATAHLSAGRCSYVTYSSGNLWAACADGRNRTEFLSVNPLTGQVTGRAGPVPGQIQSIVIAPASVWYLNDDENISGLVGIGGRTRLVTVQDPAYPVSFADTNSLVYGQGSIWALTGDESVARIDPATGRVMRVYTFRSYDPQYVGGLDFLTVGHGSLWFLDDGELNLNGSPFGGVLQVSMATGRPLARIPGIAPGACGEPCYQIYSTPSAIWVPTESQLIRIDPARLPG